MIEMKDLKHRDYNLLKECVSFQYTLSLGEEAQPMLFYFRRTSSNKPIWLLETKINRTNFSDSQWFGIQYEMPQKGLPLTLICATGLRYFKMHIQSEVQYRTNIDFTIGNVTEGM